ncbi:MAG: DUF523 domain-containing protein [Kiritimatiellae bacterium]|nr:DUF523 domain-containing protein [Kiritimatiellia bacterium]
MKSTKKIPIGVSACLLGKPVRYDGQHKYDPLVAEKLATMFAVVPVCPETECGLGVPREPMRLVESRGRVRLVTVRTGIDHTRRVKTWAVKALSRLQEKHICGFVFKSRSPSCGLCSVEIYNRKGIVTRYGRGMFAALLVARFPSLPCQEECCLTNDKIMREFVARVRTRGKSHRTKRTLRTARS